MSYQATKIHGGTLNTYHSVKEADLNDSNYIQL